MKGYGVLIPIFYAILVIWAAAYVTSVGWFAWWMPPALFTGFAASLLIGFWADFT